MRQLGGGCNVFLCEAGGGCRDFDPDPDPDPDFDPDFDPDEGRVERLRRTGAICAPDRRTPGHTLTADPDTPRGARRLRLAGSPTPAPASPGADTLHVLKSPAKSPARYHQHRADPTSTWLVRIGPAIGTSTSYPYVTDHLGSPRLRVDSVAPRRALYAPAP
jgi:hypothetical protein